MKTTTLGKALLAAMLAAASISTAYGLAQPTKPADKTSATKPAPSAPAPAPFDQQLAQMQAHMALMQAQMEKIRQAKTAKERQELMQQHWATMQSSMALMHGMWGPNGMGQCMSSAAPGQGAMMNGMMHGPMMGWGQMQGCYDKLTPEQEKRRAYMNDQYLRMQQMMMEHMMQHQYWMGQPEPAGK